MKELYKPLNIPNLKIIQTELLNCIAHDYKSKGIHAFTYTVPYMEEKCPTLMAWLVPRSKLPLRLLRFYVTPPKSKLSIHIDGGGNFPVVPFGFNIPVTGCENTHMVWYNCTEDNMTPVHPAGYLGATYPKEYSKLSELDRIEIAGSRPYLTNNSVMHGVINNTDEFRVMFTVRWTIDYVIGRTIEECFDTTDLFL